MISFPYKKKIALTCLMIFNTNTQAATINVNSTLDDGVNCTLRNAIESVNNGAEAAGCTISAGVLGENDVINFDLIGANNTINLEPNSGGQLRINKSVHINGPDSQVLKIDAGGTGRAFFAVGEQITISDLSISNGYSEDRNGAGIFIGSNTTLNIIDSVISENNTGVFTGTQYDGQTVQSGSAIYIDAGGAVNIANSTITNNTAAGGSAVSAYRGATISITDSNISANTGEAAVGALLTSRIKIGNSEIINNTGSGVSGGPSTTMEIVNSSISNNTGNGISMIDNTVYGFEGFLIENSTIANNGHTGINTYSSDGDIINSTVSNNSSTTDGGGLNLGGGIFGINVINTTISQNSSTSNGGGIHARGGRINLYNNIISGNSALGSGSEIYKAEGRSLPTLLITLNNVIGESSQPKSQAFFGIIPSESNILASQDGTLPQALSKILKPLANNGCDKLIGSLNQRSCILSYDLPKGSVAIAHRS